WEGPRWGTLPLGSQLTTGHALVQVAWDQVIRESVLQLGQVAPMASDGRALHSVGATRCSSCGVADDAHDDHVLQPAGEPAPTPRPCSWAVIGGQTVLADTVGAKRLETTRTPGQPCPRRVIASGLGCPTPGLGDDASGGALPRRLALGALGPAGLPFVDGAALGAGGPEQTHGLGHVCGPFFDRWGWCCAVVVQVPVPGCAEPVPVPWWSGGGGRAGEGMGCGGC